MACKKVRNLRKLQKDCFTAVVHFLFDTKGLKIQFSGQQLKEKSGNKCHTIVKHFPVFFLAFGSSLHPHMIRTGETQVWDVPVLSADQHTRTDHSKDL